MRKSVSVAMIAMAIISCGDPVGPKNHERPVGLAASGVGAAAVGATAAFTYSCNGLSCNFDATSSTGASTYSWNFGDGRGGGVPVHPNTYAAAGTYTVTLTTSPAGPSSSVSQTITVGAAPPSGSVADFTYSCTGLSCNFDASTSTGATSYSWNFGDGTGGGVPVHPKTYAAAGTYTVTMTTLPSGPSSVKSKTIVVGSPPTGPTVTANSPTNGSTSVGVGVVPTVTFSKAMNTATLTSSTVTLAPTSGGAAVAASMSYTSATNTLTLTPASSLSYSTNYTLTVTTGAQASDGTSLATAFTSSFTTAAGPDVTPPVVNSVSPANGTSNVSTSPSISVTFSEPMDATTMNTTTVALSSNGFATVVPATVSYNAGTNTATLTPTGALSFNTAYAIRVSTGVKDVAGNALASTFTSSFTTAAPSGSVADYTFSCTGLSCNFDGSISTGATSYSWNFGDGSGGGVPVHPRTYAAPGTYTVTLTTLPSGPSSVKSRSIVVGSAPPPPPTVTANSPTNGSTSVSVNVGPTVTFSKSMNSSTLTASTVTLAPTSGGAAVSASYGYSSGTNTLTVTPSSALAYSTSYTLTVTTGAQASDGTSLASTFSSSFTTASAPDVTPPSVNSVTPANGTSNAAIGTSVSLTFSEPMDASTISGTTVSLKVTSTSAAVAATVGYNAGTNTATLTPTSALSYSTAYTIGVSTAVKDVAGNPMSSVFSSGFTTTAPPPPPTVVSNTPTNGSTSVTVGVAPTVTFSKAMNSSTLTSSTVTLAPTSGGASLSTSLSYAAGTNTLTVTPASALANSTSYTLTVTTGAQATDGSSLASTFTSSFTTAAPSGSVADYTFSCTGLSCNFDGSISTGATSYSWNFGDGSGGGVPVHPRTYAAPGTYTVTLTTLPSGPSSVKSRSIVVGSAPPPPPTVTANSPTNGSTSVSVNVGPTVTFSKSMNSSTLTASTVTLAPTSGGAAVSASYGYSSGTNTLTVTPSSALAYSTSYTLTVTTGAQASDGTSLASTFSSSFTTASAPDVTPPSVNSVTPANGTSNVAIGTSVSLTFSEPMDATTISGTTITLRSTTTLDLVPATVGYSAGTNTATLTPTSPLSYARSYTVGVSTAVKDVAGNPMSSVFSSAFTTGAAPDVTPPTVTSVAPANGASSVSINPSISVVFSEAMNASTISGTTVTLKATSTSSPVSASVSYNAGTNTATLTPSGALSYSTAYTIGVSTGAQDVAGNSLGAAFSSGFTTVAPPDVTPPSVVSSSPANNAAGVATSSALTVTFSEAMNPTTISGSTLQLSVSGGGSVGGTVTYDGTTFTATFTPTSPLASGTSYTLIATTGVRDIAGNALATQYSAGFSTLADLTGQPYFQGTTNNAGTDEVHIHIIFAQSGTNLSLAPGCPIDQCILLARNDAGTAIIGPPTPGSPWATMTSLTGTINGSQINFSFTLDNGRTFSYSGTVTSSSSMTGTFSGATQPPISVVIARGP